MTTISVLLTMGRLALRWHSNRRIGPDDWLNALAALLCVPFAVITMRYLPDEYWGQRYYLGLGGKIPTFEEQVYGNKLELATLLLFWLIIYLVKASFLALYWHLFRVSSRFLIVWWCTAGFIVLSFLITMTSVLWKCGNPADILDLGTYDAIDLFWLLANSF